jgi:hypothetical protein
LGSFVKGLFFFVVLVNLDEFGSVEELHDHGSSNDWGDTELHEGSSVGGEDGTHPIEGV